MKIRFLSAIVSLLVLSVVLMLGCTRSSSQTNSSGNRQQAPLGSTKIVDGTVAVDAGAYYAIEFSVTSEMTNPTVKGSFKASGGDSDNNIIALVLDDNSFNYWSTGTWAISFIYNSGRVTSSNINVSIALPGTYHFVFNNNFATTAKQVTAAVDLQWEK